MNKIEKHIVEILKRNKYINDYAGVYPFDKEEYAKMIDEEVVKKEIKKERVKTAKLDITSRFILIIEFMIFIMVMIWG